MDHREYARCHNVGLLRKLREELGITQLELANKIGIPQSGIARIENGRQSPTLRFLDRIATAIGRYGVFTFEKPADMRFRSDTSTSYFKVTF